MNKLFASLATVAALACAPSAHAATAFLQRCDTGSSVTGRFVYIGTYEYAGNVFTRTFSSYCPQSVTVY